MNKHIKTIIEEIVNEVIAGGASVDGNPTFRGGAYGFGNKNQLATFQLDPSVKKIEDQEQDEINQNVEDQNWISKKFKDTANLPNDGELNERTGTDMYYMDLPGFPKMNTIEAPVQHVPSENMTNQNKQAGTIGGAEDGTEHYVIDDIEADLNTLRKEGASGGANYSYQMQSALPAFDVEEEEESGTEEETLGHMAMDKANLSPIGGYGTVMFPRKFVPDEWAQESDTEDEDMDGIADRIDMDLRSNLDQMKNEGKRKPNSLKTRHPKKYDVDRVPSSAMMAKKAKEAMRSLSELSVMLLKNGHQESVNTIDRMIQRISEEMEAMNMHGVFESVVDEDAMDEKYASKAQQRYFHAKSAEGNPKFKDLADEFDSETSKSQFKKLPEKAPKKESALDKLVGSLLK